MIYSIGRRTTNVTSGQPAMDVAYSSGGRPRLREVGWAIAGATASIIGLNRPTAIGTRTTPTALLAEDPADPTPVGIALLDSALAWSVLPTLATDDLRRMGVPATVGQGIIWTFPEGLRLAASGSVALVNRAANAVLDAYVVVEV